MSGIYGLILGNSGSGKTTILKSLGGLKNTEFDHSKSVVSQFPNLSKEEVSFLLFSVGLSSIPIWLNKPQNLSNGEFARFDLAWHLANTNKDEIMLYDEFTSVVNRDCAKSMSHALQRYVRANNLKIILSSCHYDIINWLNADWVFNLNKRTDGECEIERLVYSDSRDYEIYKNIENNVTLSKEYSV